jgi:hypothetical protein
VGISSGAGEEKTRPAGPSSVEDEKEVNCARRGRRRPVPQSTYEFRVSGRLSENAFEGLRIVHAPPETIIYGSVIDESQLHGILVVLENLGLTIVSVHRIPEPAE